MINKELFYKVTLIDCNGKELEVAKFLQILTGMEKTETRRIVASLPCVLYMKSLTERRVLILRRHWISIQQNISLNQSVMKKKCMK